MIFFVLNHNFFLLFSVVCSLPPRNGLYQQISSQPFFLLHRTQSRSWRVNVRVRQHCGHQCNPEHRTGSQTPPKGNLLRQKTHRPRTVQVSTPYRRLQPLAEIFSNWRSSGSRKISQQQRTFSGVGSEQTHDYKILYFILRILSIYRQKFALHFGRWSQYLVWYMAEC